MLILSSAQEIPLGDDRDAAGLRTTVDPADVRSGKNFDVRVWLDRERPGDYRPIDSPEPSQA